MCNLARCTPQEGAGRPNGMAIAVSDYETGRSESQLFQAGWELLRTIEGISFMGIFVRMGLPGFVRKRTFTAPAILRNRAIFLATLALAGAAAGTAGQSPAPAKAAPVMGTIKAISAGELTLISDAGAEVHVSLAAEVKLLRVPPGSKDLKEAVAIQLSELQAGDRILVRGKAGDAAPGLVASSIIGMKKSDLTDKQAQGRDEWQKHGIGGLVKSTDEAGKITISTMSLAGNKDVTVVVGKSTVVRRYAATSVKFDDAKPSTIAEIRAGDQLRPRGTRIADAGEFAADEIVSGSFRNISGTISAVDAGAGTITLTDLATKRPVEIKIAADSQLRKLPEMMAQRIAVRLKGGVPDAGGSATAGAAKPAGTQADAGGRGAGALANPTGAAAGGRTGTGNGGVAGPGGGPGGGGAGARGAAGGDLQQRVARCPGSALSEFRKG